jgi:hypothetical protein
LELASEGVNVSGCYSNFWIFFKKSFKGFPFLRDGFRLGFGFSFFKRTSDFGPIL